MITLISNAILVDKQSTRKGALLLVDKKIAAIYEEQDKELPDLKVDRHINAQNHYLLPGFVDCHAHFRDPGFTHKENLKSGSLAALHGGYTYVNLMANTQPVCDNRITWQDIQDRAQALDLCGIHQAMSLTKGLAGKELVSIAEMPAACRVLSDDGKDLISANLFYKACVEAVKYDKVIMIHPEEPEISSYDYYVAEELSILRAIYFAYKTGAKLHLSHVSTATACQLLQLAKQIGAKVTAEATPHHIALADLNYRVNPPIRKEADRQALVQAISAGLIDVIGTDHAPHTAEDKLNGAPGLVGLESAFAVTNTILVKEAVISLNTLSAMLSYNPAQILQLAQRGLIAEGYYADLVLVDPDARHVIEPQRFYSKAQNTPFAGREYFGKVLLTVREGEIHEYDN